MVFNLTHSQLILRYKENGGRIEPYTIIIMMGAFRINTYSAELSASNSSSVVAKKMWDWGQSLLTTILACNLARSGFLHTPSRPQWPLLC
jgi:hypothetical protein